MFSSVDIVIASVVAVFVVIGVVRGVVHEVLALLFLVAAMLTPVLFADEAMSFFYSQAGDEMDDQYRSAVYAFIFALMFLGVLLLGIAVRHAANKTIGEGLGAINHLLGGLSGALRGIAICIALIMLAGLTSFPESEWWGRSELVPMLQPALDHIVDWLPRDILPPEYKEGLSGS